MKTISTSIFCILAIINAEGKCGSPYAFTNFCTSPGHTSLHACYVVCAPDTINAFITTGDTITFSITFNPTFCDILGISVSKDSVLLPTYELGYYGGYKSLKCLYSGPGTYKLSFRHNSTPLEKSFIFNPLVSSLVENDANPNIKVFPNPSSSKFNFDGMNPGDQIFVYDFTGTLLKQIPCNSISESVDLSSFSSALYYYRVIDEKRRILKSGKLILN